VIAHAPSANATALEVVGPLGFARGTIRDCLSHIAGPIIADDADICCHVLEKSPARDPVIAHARRL
jgi:hypothetical protein